jgi:hypothetical protein
LVLATIGASLSSLALRHSSTLTTVASAPMDYKAVVTRVPMVNTALIAMAWCGIAAVLA